MGLELESVCMLYAKHKLYNEIATQKRVLCFVNRNAFWQKNALFHPADLNQVVNLMFYYMHWISFFFMLFRTFFNTCFLLSQVKVKG